MSKDILGQDPTFSQFDIASPTINPALIGSNMSSLYRFTFLTKKQSWGINGVQPYVGNMINLERDLMLNKAKYNRLYIAVSMLNESSNQGILNNNFFNFTLSNKVRISEKNSIKTAIQATYTNLFVNLNNSNFQSEFGNYGFLNNINTFDPIPSTSNSYYELNPGVIFEHQDSTYDFLIGGAIFHASNPRVSFFNNIKYQIPIRYVINGSLKLKLKNKNELIFSGYFQSNSKINRLTIGGLYSININNSIKSLSFGIWNKFNEALYPYFAFKYNKIQLGISYDILENRKKISNFSTSSLETSMIWSFGN